MGRALYPTTSALAIALAMAGALGGCDDARKAECARFQAVTRPLDDPAPTAASVQKVSADLDGAKFQDQPISVYTKNLRSTLAVLANLLALKAGGSSPDGTDAVIRQRLKEARTDRDDVVRYCTP